MTSYQTVFRSEHTKNYTVICNHVFQDAEISIGAAGLLGKMLSLPDNWIFNIKHLSSIAKTGVRAVWSAMKELEEKRYVVKYPVRDKLGRFVRWVTEVYESPKADRERVESSLQKSRSGAARSRKQHPIESNEVTNSRFDKRHIDPPPTSSEISAPREEEIKAFLGIKSSSHLLATFGATVQPLKNAIASELDRLTAAAAVEKAKAEEELKKTQETATAANSVLRKLSEITGESIETLRTNPGLQKSLERYSHNVEGVLQYLEAERTPSFKPGIGLVVISLREGRKLTSTVTLAVPQRSYPKPTPEQECELRNLGRLTDVAEFIGIYMPRSSDITPWWVALNLKLEDLSNE